MTHADLLDRALGSLLGLAIGDALGMPTQTMSRAEIAACYGAITGFRDATCDQPVAPGMPAGSITDDTDQALLLARLLIDGDGTVDPYAFANALAEWERVMRSRGSLDLLGPSTTAAIAAIAAGAGPDDDPGHGGTTNGAAMRIAPVGIAFAPDSPQLLTTVVAASRLTHHTDAGLGSAAAVAASVSAALETPRPAAGAPAPNGSPGAIEPGHPAPADSRLATIIEAGATAADTIAAGTLAHAGNPVATRPIGALIREAVSMVAALPATAALDVIASRIGTSVAAVESVPAAFALVARFGDDPVTALLHAAAIGDDTDTIGAIAGAILGAVHGAAAWPAHLAEKVVAVNDLDLEPVAHNLIALRLRATSDPRRSTTTRTPVRHATTSGPRRHAAAPDPAHPATVPDPNPPDPDASDPSAPDPNVPGVLP